MNICYEMSGGNTRSKETRFRLFLTIFLMYFINIKIIIIEQHCSLINIEHPHRLQLEQKNLEQSVIL